MGLMADLGHRPVGVDTAIFIYFIEERPQFLPLVEQLFREADEGHRELITSALTLLEVLVVPYRSGDHLQWFPRFQFQDGRPSPAVADVIKIFPEQASGWELAYFFVTPNMNISGRKPLELLKQDPARLASLAHAFVHPADVF